VLDKLLHFEILSPGYDNSFEKLSDNVRHVLNYNTLHKVLMITLGRWDMNIWPDFFNHSSLIIVVLDLLLEKLIVVVLVVEGAVVVLLSARGVIALCGRGCCGSWPGRQLVLARHGAQLYLRLLQRVVVRRPVKPVDSVTETLVFAFEVESVEVGVVAGAVPPRSFKPFSTVVLPGVVVVISGAELGPLLGQALPELAVHARVDYSILVVLPSDDQIVDDDLRCVPIPGLQGDQHLLRPCQCNVVPIGQTQPVVLILITKSKLVIVPTSKEVVLWISVVSPPLNHRPTSAVFLHVAVDVDKFTGYKYFVNSAPAHPIKPL